MATKGKILGKNISISLKPKYAITERLRKARNTWRQLRNKIFQRTQLKPKTKLLLWNAVIRSTLTYALQTQNIGEKDQKSINAFTFKCLRQISNKYWYKKKHKPNRTKVYKKHRQPSTISWIQKLRTIHMLKHTAKNWKIHHEKYPYVKNTTSNWEKEWQEHEKQVQGIIQQQNQVTRAEINNIIETQLAKYMHGWDTKNTVLKKLLELRTKYGTSPQLQQLEPKEQEIAAQIMLHTPKTTKLEKMTKT